MVKVVEHGLLWAGLQRRLRRARGTATRQQVPSHTPNGHSRQHKGGSELSGAATLSPIHSPRDAAIALAPGPMAALAQRSRCTSASPTRPHRGRGSQLSHPVPSPGVFLAWARRHTPSLSNDHHRGLLRPQRASLGQYFLVSCSQQPLEMGATLTLFHR